MKEKKEKIEKEKEEKLEEEKKKEKKKKEGEETISTEQHNEALVRAREAEAEKRELEKELKSLKKNKGVKKVEPSGEDEEDFWEKQLEEEEKGKKKKKEEPNYDEIIDEKLKPFKEAQKKRENIDKKESRKAFFKEHPEYQSDTDAWNELLDEMDNSINPNSSDSYFVQLEKAHRILHGGGESSLEHEITKKNKEIAGEASGGGEGGKVPSEKSKEDSLNAEERREAKKIGITDEQALALKKKQKDGSMNIFYPINR
jgi:hypothetical protein